LGDIEKALEFVENGLKLEQSNCTFLRMREELKQCLRDKPASVRPNELQTFKILCTDEFSEIESEERSSGPMELFEDEFFETEVLIAQDDKDALLACDANGDTLLMRLSAFGHAASVSLLLKHGVSVGNLNKNSKTALTLVAMNKHSPTAETFTTAKLLIKYGAEVNHQDGQAWSPLMYACREANIPLIQLLIDNRADLEMGDCHGFTPLLVNKGNLRVAEILLVNGADIHVKDLYGEGKCLVRPSEKDGMVVMTVGGRNNHEQCMILSKHKDYGWTAIMWASYHNWSALARLLLAHGAILDGGAPPFKSKGIGIQSLNPFEGLSMGGRTPLLCMFLEGNSRLNSNLPQTVTTESKLLTQGNRAAWTSGDRDLSTLKVLCENRAYINKADRLNKAALTYACMYNRQDVAEYLISQGAVYHEVSVSASEASLAVQLKRHETLTWLSGSDLHIASYMGDLHKMFRALHCGRNDLYQTVNAFDSHGWTALHSAGMFV
jgi:ankyrin repeat protein